MLCTKEAADRARKAAFVLLVEMGRSLLRWAEVDDPKGMGRVSNNDVPYF